MQGHRTDHRMNCPRVQMKETIFSCLGVCDPIVNCVSQSDSFCVVVSIVTEYFFNQGWNL